MVFTNLERVKYVILIFLIPSLSLLAQALPTGGQCRNPTGFLLQGLSLYMQRVLPVLAR